MTEKMTESQYKEIITKLGSAINRLVQVGVMYKPLYGKCNYFSRDEMEKSKAREFGNALTDAEEVLYEVFGWYYPKGNHLTEKTRKAIEERKAKAGGENE